MLSRRISRPWGGWKPRSSPASAGLGKSLPGATIGSSQGDGRGRERNARGQRVDGMRLGGCVGFTLTVTGGHWSRWCASDPDPRSCGAVSGGLRPRMRARTNLVFRSLCATPGHEHATALGRPRPYQPARPAKWLPHLQVRTATCALQRRALYWAELQPLKRRVQALTHIPVDDVSPWTWHPRGQGAPMDVVSRGCGIRGLGVPVDEAPPWTWCPMDVAPPWMSCPRGCGVPVDAVSLWTRPYSETGFADTIK